MLKVIRLMYIKYVDFKLVIMLSLNAECDTYVLAL